MPFNPSEYSYKKDITVVSGPASLGGSHVAIHYRGKPQLALALLSEGMFSLIAHRMGGQHIDDVVFTMGQVVLAHVATSPDSIGEEGVLREIAQLESGFAATGPMTWGDLPGASVRHFLAPKDTIYCGVRLGRQAAIYVSIQDPAMVFSWARFSAARPTEPFVLAFGRVVIANFHPAPPAFRDA